MKSYFALSWAAFGLAAVVFAQDTQAPLPAPPAPAPLPALPAFDFCTPPATESIWTSNPNRDYHFYANVGLNYMWLRGGNPFSAGPLTGPSFSAGVLNNSGVGVDVKGSELYQSNTHGAAWETPHRP
jgi:hypothetical protein